MLLVVALVPFVCSCSAASGQTLRVLTYNIHHGEGVDGKWDLARIADVIKQIKPDVVALQELDHGNARSGADVLQIRELASLTEMEGRFGKSMDYRGGAYGNGILFTQTIALDDLQVHPLPNPRGQEPRAVMEADLHFNSEPAKRFKLFVTHLDVNRDNAAAQALVFAQLGAASQLPALLAGDFNLRPNHPAIEELRNTWSDAANGQSLRRPPIDYIMYRPADAWSIRSPGQFVANRVTAVASDHRPLVAEIELVEGSSP